MAAAPALLQDSQISFFGANPTIWNLLSDAQKVACTGERTLRKIADHFAWFVDGALLEQWNGRGLLQYNAVKASVKRARNIASPQLYLLNTEDKSESATPTVVVTCANERLGRRVIAAFEEHDSLQLFHLTYRWRPGNMTLPAKNISDTDQEELDTALKTSDTTKITGITNVHLADSIQRTALDQVPHATTLCGARIAVYTGPRTFSNPRRNIATVAGLVRIGQKRYALTTAHVFFSNVNTTGPWATSNLSVPANSRFTQRNSSAGTDSAITDFEPEPPDPSVSQIYEVVIESLWPHTYGQPEEVGILSDAIGEVSPRLTTNRKVTDVKALPEVIFNFQLDCALIEIRDTSLWLPNTITLTDNRNVRLKLPEVPSTSDTKPPKGQVLMATGVSGLVEGKGAGSIGGVVLPWRSMETPTWPIQADIAVGDSGALAISPKTGLSYGLIISHDPSILMTYIVTMNVVLEFLKSEAGGANVSFSPELESGPSNPESQTPSAIQSADTTKKGSNRTRRSLANEGDLSIFDKFLSKLTQFTLRNFSGSKFVLVHQLTEWLISTSDNDEGVPVSQVERLLDFVYPDEINYPVTPAELSRRGSPYLLVFSILLELRQAHLIEIFRRSDLNDNRLPLLSADRLAITLRGHRLKNIHLEDFIERFLKLQWAYCPLGFDNDMAASLHSECVLPIVQRQRVNNKGATAAIWEVTVPEEFVGQRLQRATRSIRFDNAGDNRGSRYQFAIKTFPRQFESLFKAERAAFRLMRENPEFIRCFGDFVQHEEYNLLLEFGEHDLAEYYAVAPPVILPTQIHEFWTNMLNIVRAVQYLHSFNVERLGTQHALSGWHQDIKPDNILSVQGTFKLADPGFAHFSRGNKLQNSISGGTEQYGPPESSRTVSDVSSSGRRFDIWSLGCILSEAATWVVLGNQGLEQYADFRRQTHRVRAPSLDDTTRRVGGNTFHDGFDVSKEVLEWHRLLRHAQRHTDHLTPSVLDCVEDYMLRHETYMTLSASEIYSRLADILKDHSRLKDRGYIVRKRNYGPALLHSLSIGPSSTTRVTSRPPRLGSTIVEPPSPNVPFVSIERTSTGSSIQPRDRTSHSPMRTSVSGLKSTSVAIPASKTAAMTRRSSVSVQTIFDAHYLEEEKKSSLKSSLLRRSSFRKTRDKILARYVASRDIIFLVDNAGSMEEHWSTVRFVLDVLTSKVSDLDNDGFEVQFTEGRSTFKGGRSGNHKRALEELLSSSRSRPVPGTSTNIARSLNKVLAPFLAAIRSSKDRGRIPDLTLIVLTNGLWEASRASDEVEHVLFQFAEELDRISGTRLDQRKRLSLEFVWFGGDPAVAERMKDLDSERNPRDLPLTIDTEPWNGDVYKMLLGSFVEEFDESTDRTYISSESLTDREHREHRELPIQPRSRQSYISSESLTDREYRVW